MRMLGTNLVTWKSDMTHLGPLHRHPRCDEMLGMQLIQAPVRVPPWVRCPQRFEGGDRRGVGGGGVCRPHLSKRRGEGICGHKKSKNTTSQEERRQEGSDEEIYLQGKKRRLCSREGGGRKSGGRKTEVTPTKNRKHKLGWVVGGDWERGKRGKWR